MATSPMHAGGVASDQPVREEHAEMWALVQRAKADDKTAWDGIYRRYARQVYVFVYCHVGSRQLAHDLMSDTFERAIKSIGNFNYVGHDLATWLLTIAHRRIADHFRSRHYRREVAAGDLLISLREDPSPEAQPEDMTLDHITNLALLTAVKQLNPEQRECIVLRFLCGLNLKETAEVMDRAVSAVKSLQGRALRTLERMLPPDFVK